MWGETGKDSRVEKAQSGLEKPINREKWAAWGGGREPVGQERVKVNSAASECVLLD